MLTFVEWSGAATGLLGAALLASNSRWSRWGFVAFLCSNLAWLGFGVAVAAWGLVMMQLGFMATSVAGIHNWFFKCTRRPG